LIQVHLDQMPQSTGLRHGNPPRLNFALFCCRWCRERSGTLSWEVLDATAGHGPTDSSSSLSAAAMQEMTDVARSFSFILGLFVRCAALAIRFPRFAQRCNCESLARWSDHDVSFAVPKGSGTGNFTVCQLADSHCATNPHAGACFNHVRGWESTLLWHWHSARRETTSMTEYRLMHTPPTCRRGDKSCTWLSGFDSLPHADTATVDTDV